MEWEMNARRFLLLIVALSVWTLAACNWTIGDCYPVEERTSGAGAGPVSEPGPIFTSTTSGDFGAEPPEGTSDGGERKIACNESDLEDEDARPTNSPESPRDPCPSVGDIAGDGAIFLSCSDACSSKCPPGMATVRHVDFDPSDFPFVTTIPDRGEDEGGGWQVAKANLKSEHMVIPGETTKRNCPITIGMPLRTEETGRIDSTRAASLSEEITEYVANRMDYNIPSGIFCKRFAINVRAAFKRKYKSLGARATNP
jgi:hypothetical protein